jgi:hypothetical protein
MFSSPSLACASATCQSYSSSVCPVQTVRWWLFSGGINMSYDTPSSSPFLPLNINFSGHIQENLQSVEQFMDAFLHLKRQELSCSRDHKEDHILQKCVWNTQTCAHSPKWSIAYSNLECITPKTKNQNMIYKHLRLYTYKIRTRRH